jgi:hypothetical protein
MLTSLTCDSSAALVPELIPSSKKLILTLPVPATGTSSLALHPIIPVTRSACTAIVKIKFLPIVSKEGNGSMRMVKLEYTSKTNELFRPLSVGKSREAKQKSMPKKEKETPSTEEISFS